MGVRFYPQTFGEDKVDEKGRLSKGGFGGVGIVSPVADDLEYIGLEDGLSAVEKVGVFRKVCVARVFLVNVGDEEFVEQGEEKLVDLRAADDEDLVESELGEIIGVVDDGDAFVRPIRITGEDDILSLRERSADGVKRGATHEDGVAAGGFFEELQILREMPGEIAVATDGAVWIVGDNGDEFH